MSALPLDPVLEAGLRQAHLSYPEIGQTAAALPSGYRTVRRQRVLVSKSFEDAVDDLMGWRIHRRAGLRVYASGDVSPNAVVLLRLGFGPVGVDAPCRVVYVVDEPHRRGFAYGTLRGHPESGEEAFIMERDVRGSVTFTIRAFSKPATRPARAAGPVGHLVQDLITTRYLRAAEG